MDKIIITPEKPIRHPFSCVILEGKITADRVARQQDWYIHRLLIGRDDLLSFDEALKKFCHHEPTTREKAWEILWPVWYEELCQCDCVSYKSYHVYRNIIDRIRKKAKTDDQEEKKERQRISDEHRRIDKEYNRLSWERE